MKKKKLKKRLLELEAKVAHLEIQTKKEGRPVSFFRFRDLPALPGPLSEGEKTPEAEQIRLIKRLNAIEEATDIKLTPKQRQTVLNPDRPDFSGWGRASGKTTAAYFWTLFHREDPIDWMTEETLVFDHRLLENTDKLPLLDQRAIPDTDLYLTHTTFRFLRDGYMDLKLKCLRKGIETCPTYYNRSRE